MEPDEKGDLEGSEVLATAEVTTSLVKLPGRLRRMKRPPGPKSLTHEQSQNVRRMTVLLRDKLGSGTEIHRATELSQQSISNILTGKPIGLQSAREIARYYGVPVEQLLSGDIGPVALEKVIQRNRGRWHDFTISAVRKAAFAAGLEDVHTEPYWEKKLDRIESVLVPAFERDIDQDDVPRRRR